MKALIVAGLLTVGSIASAQNPDQRTSFGFNITDTYTPLTLARQPLRNNDANGGTVYSAAQSTLRVTQLTFDVRVPLTESFTFSLEGGPNKAHFFEATHSGYSLGAGVRYYLPDYRGD